MRKLATACGIATLLSFAAAMPTLAQQTTPGGSAPKAGATKMSQAECESLWNRADSSKSGNLSQTQAQSFVTNFSSVDTNNDGKISQSEFQAGCEKGLVHSSATTGTGAGTSGSATPGGTKNGGSMGTSPGGSGSMGSPGSSGGTKK